MSDSEARNTVIANGLPTTHPVKPPPPVCHWVPWKERIRHFSWQWMTVVTATSVTSSLIHIWPFHNDSPGVKIVALVVFLIALVVFIFNWICVIIKAILFPKDALRLITDLTQSCFSGFIAVAGAGLIEGALNTYLDWGIGSNGFLYTLWGLWWFNACLAYAIGFGVIFLILGQKGRDPTRVVPVWIMPIVALIASSTCGGLVGATLMPHSHSVALVSTVFALTMAVIGLSLTTMVSWSFFLRFSLHGALNADSVLATWNTLTPLGQGGFSLLVNGHNLSKLIPAHVGDDFPQATLSGQMLFSVAFCVSYVLWCMGLAWIMVSVFTVCHRANEIPKFTIAHWSVIFPNGVFALCSVQLGNVLENRFYKGFGAAWSIIVFIMWVLLVIRSVLGFIDGTIFLPPAHPSRIRPRNRHKEVYHDSEEDMSSARSVNDTLCEVYAQRGRPHDPDSPLPPPTLEPSADAFTVPTTPYALSSAQVAPEAALSTECYYSKDMVVRDARYNRKEGLITTTIACKHRATIKVSVTASTGGAYTITNTITYRRTAI